MRRAGAVSACVLFLVAASVCSRAPKQVVLTADMPLHLEDHLDAATFTEVAGADVPAASLTAPVEWRFDQPQPDWKATPLWNPPYDSPTFIQTADSLRVVTTDSRGPDGRFWGTMHVEVPNWDRKDWTEIVVRARADRDSPPGVLGLGFNLRAGRGDAGAPEAPPFQFAGEQTPVVRDGTVRTYRLKLNVTIGGGMFGGLLGDGIFAGPWRQLILFVGSAGAPGRIDLFSVSVVPKGATPVPTPVEWRFDEPQVDWRPSTRGTPAVLPERTNDALRLTLPESSRGADKRLMAGIYADLAGWRREEWAHVIVRARTSTATTLNVRTRTMVNAAGFGRLGGSTPIVSDGSIQTYQILLDWPRDGNRPPTPGPWVFIGLEFYASEPGSIDILSVSVTPIATLYAQDRERRSIMVGSVIRRSVLTHAPGRLEYRVRIPEGGGLHTALGILDAPVEFRVTARPARGEATTIFRETYADPEDWADRTIDLSSFAGETITLGLETSAGEANTVAFWGSPTLSGARRTDKPNVIFYVIDGGGADYMSVYGYNRRTTPTLEKLAAEGVVFEHAYSNSSSTTPSTASFMTSLHSSVLRGNLGQGIPSEAVTMAERFHRAGYQTAVFTTNPNASSHGLERGADVLPESGPRSNARSSLLLHQAFWTWRERSPGQPFWVHFQTTDVHDSDDTFGIDRVTPFAGLFLSQEEERALNDDVSKLEAVEGYGIYSDSWRQTGISRVGFFTQWQALYDQTLAHNDYHLGRLIDRLKALGEWHNTLLIVSADHSITAATTDLALAQLDPLPPSWSLTDGGNTTGPMLRSSVSRVPLIVVWPGHLAGGRRFDTPVSLIDVLPTVLDLAGLPKPEVLQGQSLAPLLRGQSGWTPRPVILDEFGTDPATGELRGRIEVIDGRWGVSMWVGPPVPNPARQRPWPVLLYDLWNDPLCIAPVNEQQPDLVDKYTKFLLDQWKDHEALAKQFKPGPKVALTPEQLERLRSLGYIR